MNYLQNIRREVEYTFENKEFMTSQEFLEKCNELKSRYHYINNVLLLNRRKIVRILNSTDEMIEYQFIPLVKILE